MTKRLACGAYFIYYARMKKGGWGFDVRDMDAAVRPQDDFFHYANGCWLKRHDIPPHESRWGSFVILRYETEKKLRKLVKEIRSAKRAKEGSPKQMIRDFYESGLALRRRNALGLTPLRPRLPPRAPP